MYSNACRGLKVIKVIKVIKGLRDFLFFNPLTERKRCAYNQINTI